MLSYLLATLTFAGIYALLALGLNVIWGMAGMINLGLAGFFALGAYAAALATVALGLPIIVGIVIAIASAALAGALLSRLTLNLRGDYLAIVTLGFGEVIRLLAANEIWLTNGSDGIPGIPGPFRGVLTPLQFNALCCALVLLAVAISWWMTERLRRSPYGRALRAIRDDETAAAVAGKPVRRYKVQAFGRVGTMDCSIAPLTEPDMRTTHPALWIGPSKCQLKLGRYLRGVKFHPSGFQRYQSSCEPGNRIGPRHARTVGLVPNTPAAIRGTGGSPAARPHCQKMPDKEAGSLLLTHDDSSQPTADMSVEYTQSLDTLFRAEPEVRHPPVEVAAETRHTR